MKEAGVTAQWANMHALHVGDQVDSQHCQNDRKKELKTKK